MIDLDAARSLISVNEVATALQSASHDQEAEQVLRWKEALTGGADAALSWPEQEKVAHEAGALISLLVSHELHFEASLVDQLVPFHDSVVKYSEGYLPPEWMQVAIWLRQGCSVSYVLSESEGFTRLHRRTQGGRNAHDLIVWLLCQYCPVPSTSAILSISAVAISVLVTMSGKPASAASTYQFGCLELWCVAMGAYYRKASACAGTCYRHYC